MSGRGGGRGGGGGRGRGRGRGGGRGRGRGGVRTVVSPESATEPVPQSVSFSFQGFPCGGEECDDNHASKVTVGCEGMQVTPSTVDIGETFTVTAAMTGESLPESITCSLSDSISGIELETLTIDTSECTLLEVGDSFGSALVLEACNDDSAAEGGGRNLLRQGSSSSPFEPLFMGNARYRHSAGRGSGPMMHRRRRLGQAADPKSMSLTTPLVAAAFAGAGVLAYRKKTSQGQPKF